MSGRYTKAEALGEEMFRRRAGRAKVRSVKNKNGTTSRSGCGDKWSCGEIFCPKLLRRAFAQPFPDRFWMTDISYDPHSHGNGVSVCRARSVRENGLAPFELRSKAV